MKTLRIGIASYEEMKARTIDVAAGRVKVRRDDPTVWFPSLDSVAKVHGSRDRLIPRRRIRPDAVVPGAGHLVNLTHAEVVNRFIAGAIDVFAADSGASAPGHLPD